MNARVFAGRHDLAPVGGPLERVGHIAVRDAAHLLAGLHVPDLRNVAIARNLLSMRFE